MERLEDRALLSITTATGFTMTPVEGAGLSIPVASFTSPDNGPFTAEINWGDGTSSAGVVSGGPSPATFTVSGDHTYVDELLPANLLVTIDDTSDNTTGTATGSVTVTEGDTLLPLGSFNISATEGTTFSSTAVATFSDTTHVANLPTDFSAEIQWGDGTTSAGTVTGGNGTLTVAGTHLYTDELAAGTPAIVVLTDDPPGTATGTATGTVSVGDADTLAPVGSPATLTATQGVAFSSTAVATFSDTYTANTASDFTATINWGDGSSRTGTVASTTPGTLTVGGSHTYAAAGTQNPTVTLTDDAPGTAVAVATATVSVSGLTVSKSVPFTSTIGDAMAETITLTNSGSTAVTGVAFSDTLGTSGYNFVSASDTLNTALSFNSSTGKLTGTLATLGASDTDTVTLTLIPTAAGTLSDTASVTSSGVTSTATASSTVSAGATPANVSIKKSAPTSGTVGAPVSDTVTLTNAASAAASGVTLFDTLGPGQTFISASDTVGSAFSFDAASNTVIGFMSPIPGSGTDTVTINVVPTAAGTMTDTANVAVIGGNSAATITASGSTTVAAAPATKVNVAKSAPATAIVGAVVTETVTLTNAGSSAASNVAFTDNFFAGNVALASVSDTAGSTFSFNANTDTITGTIASLAASGVDTITLKYVPLTDGTVTDTAAITIAGGNSGTSSSSASTSVSVAPSTAPNIAVAKSSAATAPVGSLLTTTVTLTNNTIPATAATNVLFLDQLDPGQTFVSASDTGGNTFTLSNGQVTGTIASLGTGTSNTDTITIVTLVTGAAGTTTGDTAVIGVTGGNQAAPLASQTVSVSAGVAPADVSVAKSAPATGTVGTQVTDTVTLTSAAAVTNVSFVDMLPGNVSGVAASDAAGDKFTFANGQITGTIASLATGATKVTIVYTPTAAGDYDDTALIGIAAGNTGTSSATASTTVTAPGAANLTILKTGTPASVGVGGTETYTITVANSGGSAATGATVTDTLPAGLTLVSATDAAGMVTISGNTVTDALGTIAATTGSETLTITATANQSASGTTVSNTASLTFAGTTTPSNTVSTTIGTTPIITGVGFLAGQPGDGTIQTFVHNLYRELLGREPDSAGQTFWVSYLTAHDNSTGRNQVIAGFLNSQEYAIHYITTLYQVILGRAPDAPGLQYWTSKMGSPGTSGGATGSADEKAIVAAFFGSEEFYIKSGNTAQGWINALYEDILGRAPDGSGAAFWANELTTRGAGDRDGIVRDLLTTSEASHFVLDSFYPGVGGTSSHPLPTPGSSAGTASTDLATITGDGWENLYLQGPYGSQPQGNDSFFNSLVGGAGWDDVQLMLLDTNQFYTNPNRPIT